jgi:hypothetical protein
MSKIDISGVTEISDEGIKKHFKNIEPCQAVFELVWNGFDAKADNVDVVVSENDVHFVEAISVCDDGDGIDIHNIKENFGKFNDSQKKEDAAQHGLHGRGRLAFHRLCHDVIWRTKSTSGQAEISISGANIKKFDGSIIEQNKQHKSFGNRQKGTCVELRNFHTNLPKIDALHQLFSTEFGWYLAINSTRNLKLNGIKVAVPSHELHHERIDIDGFVFDATIIRWDEKPSPEKSYTYLRNTAGNSVHKQLSTFNNKAFFFTSIYVQSSWADNFSQHDDLLNSDGHTTSSDEWKKLVKQLGVITQQIYEDFLRRFVDREIEKYVTEGIFPDYVGVEPEYALWRADNTKSIVKAVYTADPTVFNSLNKKQKKVIVRLLDKLAISNENDSIFDVLNSVLELDGNSMSALANQLKRTTLENIISTIEVLQRRQFAANKMRELMNTHYREVLETPDLQKIIENNTWLFGHRYEILGAEEDTFTKVARSLRDKISFINHVEEADLEDGATIEGANRQSDLFLARKIPSFDSFGKRIYRCVIIEIKRPSIALNVTHLRQLDDYAAIIKKYPEFSSEHMHFELILIGRKISIADTEIGSRMRSQIPKGEMGLVSDDDRMKRYVLNWYTVLDGFELSNSFMLEKLKLQREALSGWSKEELVNDLQDCPA